MIYIYTNFKIYMIYNTIKYYNYYDYYLIIQLLITNDIHLGQK